MNFSSKEKPIVAKQNLDQEREEFSGPIIKESSDLMRFRHHWVREYTAHHKTITEQDLDMVAMRKTWSKMAKGTLLDNSMELFQGVVLMNDQINYLEAAVKRENRRYWSLKKNLSLIIGFVVLLGLTALGVTG